MVNIGFPADASNTTSWNNIGVTHTAGFSTLTLPPGRFVAHVYVKGLGIDCTNFGASLAINPVGGTGTAVTLVEARTPTVASPGAQQRYDGWAGFFLPQGGTIAFSANGNGSPGWQWQSVDMTVNIHYE
jgi:hypothetical protein